MWLGVTSEEAGRRERELGRAGARQAHAVEEAGLAPTPGLRVAPKAQRTLPCTRRPQDAQGAWTPIHADTHATLHGEVEAETEMSAQMQVVPNMGTTGSAREASPDAVHSIAPLSRGGV